MQMNKINGLWFVRFGDKAGDEYWIDGGEPTGDFKVIDEARAQAVWA